MKLGRIKVNCGLALALCLCCVFAAQAQDDKPITWTLETKPAAVPLKAGDKFEARLKSALGEGWHLYSITQPDGGPTRTTIKLAAGQPFQLAGDIQGPPPEKNFDRNFNMETEYYVEKAEFTLPLAVTADAGKGVPNLAVEVTFQLCNDRTCLPPDTITVQASLAGGAQTGAASTSSKSGVDSSGKQLAIGAQVPDFTFTDFNGQERKYSEFKGKVVLIDFWATWCSPCLADIPRLKVLSEKYKAQGLEIIGMDSETLGQDETEADPAFAKETYERAKGIINTRGVTWAQANAATAVPIAAGVFGVKSLPTKILIDREGKVVAWLKEGGEIDAQVSRLLAAK